LKKGKAENPTKKINKIKGKKFEYNQQNECLLLKVKGAVDRGKNMV